MPNYFVKSSSVNGGSCLIEGDDFHHLVKVRRTAVGAKLRLVDENEQCYNAVVTEVSDNSILCLVSPDDIDSAGRRSSVNLYAAVLKGKKFDIVIQKAVELGISRIVPVISERCIPDYGEKASGKVIRWRRIAAEAAKQSLRTSVPIVADIMSFAEVIAAENSQARFIADPAAALTFKDYAQTLRAPQNIAVFVGPEGGFSANEMQKASAAGWTAVGFDFPQLRAETAAIVIPAIVIYEWGRIV